MSNDIANVIADVIEETNLSKFNCTFTDTDKSPKFQYYYHCNDCWEEYDSGCCVACAMTCHKNHNLSELRYGSFFCDCAAESSDERKCKLYKKITYPGDKLPKVKLGKYCSFFLANNDGVITNNDEINRNIKNWKLYYQKIG